MMEFDIGGRRHPIGAGETVIGSDPACPLSLAGDGVAARHAVVLGGADGSAAVRPLSSDAVVMVNDIRLGAEPTPLLHGDTVQIGPHTLLVVDAGRGGSTQFIRAAGSAPPAAGVPRAAAPSTGSQTGGRLVCLTDGREYAVEADSFVLGREAGSDVVVDGKEVSRRHAEIVRRDGRYVVVDLSTNGVFVNGGRIEGERPLARADMIRIGSDEFRFYADPVAAPSPPPPPAPPAEPAPSAETVAAPVRRHTPAAPPLGAANRLFDTMHGVPATPRPQPKVQLTPETPPAPPAPPVAAPAPASPAAPLASMLIRSGPAKGDRIAIRVPVVNIGRADYNDVVLADSSVSTAHAKLQRREQVWLLTDLQSTNGTFVDGERVEGDVPLSPGATIRFGEVSVLFDPRDGAADAEGGGTRVLQGLVVPPAAPPVEAPVAPVPAPPPAPARRPRPVVSSPRRPQGPPAWIWPVALVVLALVVAYLLSR